ncbi:MAG: PTS sugar transporter subunit IIB [Lachnospiraceae bacterium]|nr:PTS sugar transporter subunit IIB [Lachnospiraceae bacterium]
MAKKLDGKKLLACCANGAGSSLMMENAIRKVMTRNGIKPAELRHAPVAEGKSAARSYDVVFCARPFVKTFEGCEANGTVLIPLKNVMSDKEIEAALKERDLLD